MCVGGTNNGNTCEANVDCPGGSCQGTCQQSFCVTDEQCAEGDECVLSAMTRDFGPVTSMGTSADCAALGSGSFSGTHLRGVVNFFGSSIGDIVTQVNADCL
jgi:hypothetical protein